MLKKRLLSALTLLLALALVLSVSFMGVTKTSRAIAEEETSATDDPKGEGDTEDGEILTTGAEDGSDSAETVGAMPEGNDAETPTTEESTEAEEPEEEKKFHFSLFEELAELDTKGWILLGAAAVITVALIIVLVTRKKEEKKVETQKVSATTVLVHGALCIALSFILSYIKLFSMPTGGSITLASMLPLMIYANRYGVRNGMLAGLVYGLLQYLQGGYFVHWLQFIFDYPLAFALIGLGGMTKGVNNLPFSVLIGGVARFLSHFIGGAIFFGKYVMMGKEAVTGMTLGQMLPANLWASFIYNAPYMFADIAICLVIALLPPFRKAIRQALKY